MLESHTICPLTTILYDPEEGGFYLLNRHHTRLLLAARDLFRGSDHERALDITLFTQALWECVSALGSGVRQRIRVTISPDLQYNTTATPLPKTTTGLLPLRLDTVPTSAGPLAIHKSTARDVYDTARTRTDANYASTGAPGDRPFDVLMWNEDGKVVETSIANFAVYLRGSELLSAVPNWNGTPQELERGAFVTPDLRHGLIAGVMRAELLAKGELVEGTIVKEDVLRYAKSPASYPMICFNAVRGVYNIHLMDDSSREYQLAYPTHTIDTKVTNPTRRCDPPTALDIPFVPKSELNTPYTTPALTSPSSSPQLSSASPLYEHRLEYGLLNTASPVEPASDSPFVWRRGAIIDCYDSYTNNLLQLFDQGTSGRSRTKFDHALAAHVTVLRADQISWPEFRSQVLPHLDFVILSPGPGSPHTPADIGVGADLLLAMASKNSEIEIRPIPILGVCLGHQALAALWGGKVIPAAELIHGRAVPVRHNGSGLFEGLDLKRHLRMVRYNSLTVDPSTLPLEFEIIATNPDDNEIMGLQHKTLPLYSVQFHPESICSRRSNYGVDAGKQLLRNFMGIVNKFWLANGRSERTSLATNIRDLNVLNHAEPSRADQRSAKQPVGPTTYHNSCYRIEKHDISSFILPFAQSRPELVFKATSYSLDQPFFWLDSAAAAPSDNFARFSCMGPATLDRCISYNLDTHIISCGVLKELQLRTGDTFWNWVDRIQKDLAQHVDTGQSSEGFIGGFVGYFGYEMKAGALPGYIPSSLNDSSAPHAPDAQFMFADRLISYDHWNKSWTAFGLIRDERNAATRTLFEQETGISVGMLNREFDSWVDTVRQRLERLRDADEPTLSPLHAEPLPLSFSYNSTPEAYKSAIKTCKSHIADGNSYELCLTGQYTAPAAETTPDYLAVYNHFRVHNPASHAAFISFPATQTTIMSCSPELFIRFDGENGRQAVMKPIKGTLKRSKCMCGGLCKLPACGSRKAECDAARYKNDMQRIRDFVNDPKETAENLMIADLIRANLLEFCSASSVDVTKLFALETYENVYSLVSTITGALLPSVGTVEGIRRSFPPGSMTGAPKLRSVQLLDTLETSPRRGIYSGCLGFLSLDNRAVFSVVIRTLVAHRDQLSYGAGGAITWLSDVDGEWDEVVLKARSVLKDRVVNSN